MFDQENREEPRYPRDFTAGPPVDVHASVLAAVETAKGDLPQAARLLEAAALKDAELLNAITKRYLSKACWELLRGYASNTRCEIWRAPNIPTPDREKDRVQHLARANAATLYDFRLPIEGLPRLGDATKGEVQQAATFYLRQAVDMAGKGRFLVAVVGLMKGTKPVRLQLKLTDLERCHAAVLGVEKAA